VQKGMKIGTNLIKLSPIM